MRWAVLTDIHGNHLAFQWVLKHAYRKKIDGYLILGDLVGYYSGAEKVIRTIQRFRKPWMCVRGNHDKTVAGLEDPIYFNIMALQALYWTQKNLSQKALQFIRNLPKGPKEVNEKILICHGSPVDEDLYILSEGEAWRSLINLNYPICFFGHTHLPSLFIFHQGLLQGYWVRTSPYTLSLKPSARYLINPGAVGQPRDRDPRASYGILDEETSTFTFYRVSYPIEKMVAHGRDAGLPLSLLERLAGGY